MTEGFAYTAFVTLTMGGLTALTLALLVVAVMLGRRNRES